MKRYVLLFSALIVLGATSISAEDTKKSTPVDTKTTTSSQSTKSRGITPSGKTNWSKIKDIFM